MAEDMWIVKYISHDRARRSPEYDLIDRDYISYFDIKKRINELGFQKQDSVYYMSKGRMMVELKDDAAVMNMLDEFSVAKEVCLHIYKTRGAEIEKGGDEQQPAHAAPNVVTIYSIGESTGSLKRHAEEPVHAITIDSEEDCAENDYADVEYAEEEYETCHLLSDVEYESAGEFWKVFMGNFHEDETSSSDENFDIGAETERLRKQYAKKKEKELAEKGVLSDEEVEDLFDVTEGLDGFDIDEIATIGQSQMEKEMDWAKAEDARQKKEKADKKKNKVANDMDLSDPPSTDGGNDPLGYSDEEEDESALVLFQGRKRARPKRMLEPRMKFDDVYLDDADKMPEQLIKGMCFKV